MLKHLLKYSYFFLLYPFFILKIIITTNTKNSFAPERVFFFYLILYFITFFISKRPRKSLYVRFVYICSLVFTFFEVGYVSIYKERITSSTAFILLETNSSEIQEYISEYFGKSIVLLFLLLLLPSFFILRSINRTILNYSFKEVLLAIVLDLKNILKTKFVLSITNFLSIVYKGKFKKAVLGICILSIASVVYFKSNHHNYHFLFQLYNGYTDYNDEVKKYKTFLSSNLDGELVSSIRSGNDSEAKETYVLIIGESTTRNHMGLYNYKRNTTPRLKEMVNELVVFNNVISPHTHTIPSLEKVLTFANNENPEAKFNGSIVQLMKQAGYKTYWISNQLPIGINETMVALIAKASDYTHYTNLGGQKEIRTLDERVLPYIEKVLTSNDRKKFIIVHLLGTHTKYKNRYPDNFKHFFETPTTQFKYDKAYNTINEYDNAVLYNDFIISEILNKLKKYTKKEEKTFAIYLSDHGEDVFETVDFTGHSEVIGSKPMFQIPFIYWSSDKRQLQKFKNYSSRKYMTDDLIYSIADLANVDFKGMDKERSVFNDTLIDRKRIIKSNIDFDEAY